MLSFCFLPSLSLTHTRARPLCCARCTQEFTENAMKFTLDGGISAYEFEDDREPENQDQLDQLKALMGGRYFCFS